MEHPPFEEDITLDTYRSWANIDLYGTFSTFMDMYVEWQCNTLSFTFTSRAG